MIEILIDDSSEVIAHAVEVFNETGSLLDALDAVQPTYTDELHVQLLQALAAELGGCSQ